MNPRALEPPKSIGTAYVFWLFAIHYLYFRKPGLFLLYIFTGGGFLLWTFIDLFRIPSMVDAYNVEVFAPPAQRAEIRDPQSHAGEWAFLLGLIALGAYFFLARTPATPRAGSSAASSPRAAAAPHARSYTASTPRPERVWGQLSDGTWVQHDRSVSTMQSVGGGGGYAGMPQPTPQQSPIQKAWGWQTDGTLNQPAKR